MYAVHYIRFRLRKQRFQACSNLAHKDFRILGMIFKRAFARKASIFGQKVHFAKKRNQKIDILKQRSRHFYIKLIVLVSLIYLVLISVLILISFVHLECINFEFVRVFYQLCIIDQAQFRNFISSKKAVRCTEVKTLNQLFFSFTLSFDKTNCTIRIHFPRRIQKCLDRDFRMSICKS